MSKIKLALEVVGDLRALAESIETLVNSIEKPAEETKEEQEEVKTLDETKKKSKKSEVHKKEVENVPAPEELPKEKQPTLEELRALMADKNRDGHRETVKAILNKYGAEKLTSLDTSHYKEVLKEVSEIK